ncbi:tetratricopeptide repeat protein [Dactylosporangium darangshiense]|uniref:Tetratricopeptide repeat protein n=1 Tax=Dactylosporangium darangshiense TaxID=579108 RepID=A0ABP8D909_9ACTN
MPVGPLSAAETAKLLWSLPHVDRHADTGARADRVWRVVGGHPRSLEYLDALLGQGHGRFDDITDRLTRAVTTRLGPDAATTWLAQRRTLDAALAHTVTLAADDVLLGDHLRHLATIPGATDMLIAISVYREPVSAVAPGLDAGLLDALVGSSLVHHDAERELVFMHRWTAIELHRCLGPDVDPLLLAHRAAAEYWQQRDGDLHALTEARHHLLAAGDLDAAATVTRTISRRLERTGAWDQAAVLIHDTLRWLPGEAAYFGDYIHQLGTLAHRLGDYAEAEQRYRQALAIFEQRGEQSNRASTYLVLGMLAHDRGGYSEAEQRYRQALVIFEQLDNRANLASTHHQLGALAKERGDYDEAERQYLRSLAIEEELGNEAGAAVTDHELGNLALRRGDYAEAERRNRQSMAIFERVGDLDGLGAGHQLAGMVAHHQHDYAEAEHRYEQARAIRERIGDQRGLAGTHHQLGLLAQDRGDHAEAERCYRRSLAIEERLGNQAGIATNLSQLGTLCAATDRTGEAAGFHLRAVLIRATIDTTQASVDLERLAEVRAAIGAESLARIGAQVLGHDGYLAVAKLVDAHEAEAA